MELDSIAFFRCLSPGPHVGDGDGGSGVDGLYMSHLTTLPRVSDLKWHSDCHVSDITREVRCLVDWTHLPWGLGGNWKNIFYKPWQHVVQRKHICISLRQGCS